MIDSLIREVENAIASGDPAGRRTMLARITNLFTDNADRLADRQVEALDAVILQLALRVETVARADLSQRIADIVNAPSRVVHDLAFDDDVSVAAPVLARSERIGDDALARIAQSQGQEHLFAISRRRTLSERVTDVLVVRGDTRVVRAVAGNDGARFSADGLDAMTERSRSDASLRATLAARRDFDPSPTTRSAVAVAGESAEPRSESATLREALTRIDAAAAGSSGALTEAQVMEWLSAGQVLDAVAAVARLAGAKPDAVLAAHEAADHDPMLFLLRSIRFGWGALKLFILAKPGKAATPEELRGAFEAFQALSVTTAQRVVRFNASRDRARKDVA